MIDAEAVKAEALALARQAEIKAKRFDELAKAMEPCTQRTDLELLAQALDLHAMQLRGLGNDAS
jgi:hypothetical protein